MLLHRLTIGRQLWAFVLIAALSVAIVGAAGVYAAWHSARALEHQYRYSLQPLVQLNGISTRLQETRFRMAGVLLDQMPIEGSKNHAVVVAKEVPEAWKAFADSAAAGRAASEEVKLVALGTSGLAQVETFLARLIAAYGKNDKKALEPMLEDEWPQVHLAFMKVLEKLIAEEEAASKRSFEASNALVDSLTRIAIAVAVLSVIGLIFFAGLFLRLITQALGGVSTMADRIAGGDLSMKSGAVKRSDAIGDLHRAMEKMVGGLGGTITLVRDTSEIISSASREIASGNSNLSSRTESQASSLEETAASMEELTRTVHQTAENAKRANTLVLEASKVAARGGEVVSSVVTTMDEINESANRIREITSLIDGIAFQTNILALNAAVEAARAGEHGRGFGVVASEVRQLAQRAAGAAKEIKGLIATSAAKVEQGSRMAQDAGRTMDEIIVSVKTVTDIMGDIATASRQQSTEITAIGQNVSQLEAMTQQNSALVEQAAAATESLEQQCQSLVRAAAVFRLTDRQDPVQKRMVPQEAPSTPRLTSRKPVQGPRLRAPVR